MARVILHGIPVSSGIAVGKAIFLHYGPERPPRKEYIPRENVADETARFKAAVEAVSAAFKKAGDKGREDGLRGGRSLETLQEHLDVLDSHLLICTDPKLMDDVLFLISHQHMNAEWALAEVVGNLAETFSRMSAPYLRERIQDIRVVADRIQLHLTGRDPGLVNDLGERGILLARDLTPADTLGLSPDRIMAFATEQGGKTGHTGILARSLNLPGIVGVTKLEKDVRPGETVIVDGLRGSLLVAPDEEEIAAYKALARQFDDYQRATLKNADKLAETVDGLRVAVLANVDSFGRTDELKKSGCEGAGLVRTEFTLLRRPALPGEEELAADYSALAKALAPSRVTFRTLDVGSDKALAEHVPLDEPNPALGLRAIRYCLRYPELFRRQLKAVLRASAHGNVALMFPMISGVNELRQAKSVLNEAKQELDASGIPYNPDMPVGIMIELPSAVFMADVLAEEADFFSIGTNDLIQYSLGIDRTNRHVNYLYQPLHPAIIRSIKFVVDMAHQAGISVSVCGEMAADPYCLPVLLGMAVDEISIAPQSIPAIKHLIRKSNGEECRSLLNQALGAVSVKGVNSLMRQTVYQRFPDDIMFYSSLLDTSV